MRNRFSIVCAALVAVLTCASAAPAAPEPGADTSPYFAYDTVKVAEGIYAFVTHTPRGGLVSGNSIAIIGDDGVLVVDTGHFPTLARKMIADLRRITDKPVRYVVNTHWHPDHVFGNAAYKEAFPDAIFIGHAETRRLVIKNCPAHLAQQRESAALLVQLPSLLAAGTHRNGTPLTPDERVGMKETATVMATTLADATIGDLVPSTMTFEDEVSVFLGKREVRVIHLGRGNTAGDAIVYVPDAKALMTGDVLVKPVPYAYGSYIGEWIRVLKKLSAIDASVIVPGHGPVDHDMSYATTVMDLLGAIQSQVQSAVKAGATLEQTRAKVDVEVYRRRLAGDDAGANMDFRDGVLRPAVERAYQEATGKLADE